jgi:hypothetical protein
MMAQVAVMAASARVRPAQNWILDPVQDTLLIIAAPLLALGLALASFSWLGAAAATAAILVTHVVFTVAHHLPTFIRVYGDVELFRRFRWSFLLAPVVPFAFGLGALAWINARGLPLETFLYLYIMLALWDPWHFLRQHYGFMRIYDRHNAAPRRLAARMDLVLCVSWFVFIMLASGEWLAGLLEDLNTRVQVPLAMVLPLGLLSALTALARDFALLASAAYVVYLFVCWRRGWYVSLPKIALAAVTFVVMYVAYAPNAWMASITPEWSFKVGFAVIGIVHMTQYLAIVWRYNRGLARGESRARSGWFRSAHARGGLFVVAAYVGICLAYGTGITQVYASRWLMSLLLAIGFTSTLLHYYFDGFIWKVRHAQNRENLGLANESTDSASPSWWARARVPGPAAVLTRQLAYFGIPMGLLTAGMLSASAAPANYIQHMYAAEDSSRRGEYSRAVEEAGLAFTAMRRQLPFADRIAQLQPTAAREAAYAFLLYNQSYYANVVMPALAGERPLHWQQQAHREAVSQAVAVLEAALVRGGPLAHAGRDSFDTDDARRTLASWRRVVEQPI